MNLPNSSGKSGPVRISISELELDSGYDNDMYRGQIVEGDSQDSYERGR
jgi:hypothetical protein